MSALGIWIPSVLYVQNIYLYVQILVITECFCEWDSEPEVFEKFTDLDLPKIELNWATGLN